MSKTVVGSVDYERIKQSAKILTEVAPAGQGTEGKQIYEQIYDLLNTDLMPVSARHDYYLQGVIDQWMTSGMWGELDDCNNRYNALIDNANKIAKAWQDIDVNDSGGVHDGLKEIDKILGLKGENSLGEKYASTDSKNIAFYTNAEEVEGFISETNISDYYPISEYKNREEWKKSLISQYMSQGYSEDDATELANLAMAEAEIKATGGEEYKLALSAIEEIREEYGLSSNVTNPSPSPQPQQNTNPGQTPQPPSNTQYRQQTPPQQNPGTTQQTPPQQNPGTTPQTPPQQNPGTTPQTPPEQNPGTTPETPPEENPGTTPETPPEQNPGTTPETPPEQNPGTTPETPPEQNPGTTPETPPIENPPKNEGTYYPPNNNGGNSNSSIINNATSNENAATTTPSAPESDAGITNNTGETLDVISIDKNPNNASNRTSSNDGGSVVPTILGLGVAGAAAVAGAKVIHDKKRKDNQYSYEEDQMDNDSSFSNFGSYTGENMTDSSIAMSAGKYKAGSSNDLVLESSPKNINIDNNIVGISNRKEELE